jgi:dihydroorotate dehydrogenase electron transfer subunit
VDVEHLEGGLVELTARLPHLASAALPGQFAQLRCGRDGSPLLRRPFSVAWTQDDTCSFVFAAVGEGTAKLVRARPGDRLDALGPLGIGFTVPAGPGRAVCVSGGLGCAPFPLLARALRTSGIDEVVVLSGAATAARLYPVERFSRGDAGIRVIETTDDGTSGPRGRVTSLIEAALAEPAAAVYGCGPTPMLAAFATEVTARRASTAIAEVSLEAPMGCGFGTCLGCALPVRGPPETPAWALCCCDGPVMDIERVEWEALCALPPPHVA